MIRRLKALFGFKVQNQQIHKLTETDKKRIREDAKWESRGHSWLGRNPSG